MFVFLMIIGLCSLFFGIFIEKSKENPTKSTNNLQEETIESITNINNDHISSRLNEIETYIYGINSIDEELEDTKELEGNKEIEDTGFSHILQQEINNDTYRDLNMEDKKKKVIFELIKGELSIEDACNHLNMEKGEVLLLKNLYRNYEI